MAIEIYSKSNIGQIKHFGYLQYKEQELIRKAAEKLKLACLQFLPCGISRGIGRSAYVFDI
jgi:hypothetical protein